jgi:hypothetical protein
MMMIMMVSMMMLMIMMMVVVMKVITKIVQCLCSDLEFLYSKCFDLIDCRLFYTFKLLIPESTVEDRLSRMSKHWKHPNNVII